MSLCVLFALAVGPKPLTLHRFKINATAPVAIIKEPDIATAKENVGAISPASNVSIWLTIEPAARHPAEN